MKDWGLEPIPCPFLHYAAFGGAFHCATLDVRRRGRLESYFENGLIANCTAIGPTTSPHISER